MSTVLRIPSTFTNHVAVRALGFAVAPSNRSIIYLPIGWTKEFSYNLTLIYDTAKTHRATFSHDTGTLCVADDCKQATSLKVQLESTQRVLWASQNMVETLSKQIQAMERRLEVWKQCFWHSQNQNQIVLPDIQYHKVCL